MENYLYHHGTKGMKWHIRRYQNPDGSLTPAGKERYARDIRENNAKKKDNRIIIDGPDPNRWVHEDIKKTKNTVDSVSRSLDLGKDIIDKIPNKKVDLSHMTDKELRDRVNRANLEKQYLSTFSSETERKGKKYAKEALEIGGTVLATTSSALAIALAIKELKG